MQRHKRRVPASFYYQFARDACRFADRFARGRLLSVLEGGYSDRALISGAMAHLCGLALEGKNMEEVESWWAVEKLKSVSQSAFVVNACDNHRGQYSWNKQQRNGEVAAPHCLLHHQNRGSSALWRFLPLLTPLFLFRNPSYLLRLWHSGIDENPVPPSNPPLRGRPRINR